MKLIRGLSLNKYKLKLQKKEKLEIKNMARDLSAFQRESTGCSDQCENGLVEMGTKQAGG